MTMRSGYRSRGFTLVEMLIAMAIMGIVMSFAALEFKDVVFGYLSGESHLSAEQQARVAMAKVDDLSRQASVVDGAAPTPPVLQPVRTPGPVLQFTKAEDLGPKSMPTPGNMPKPCYDYVTIELEQPAGIVNPDPSQQPHTLVEQTTPYDPTRLDCVAPNSTPAPPRIIARNVASFVVQPIECPPTKSNCQSYSQGYQIDISIFDYDDNAADHHAGALYHFSSVIDPLTFGKAQ